jgi:predicted dehydrogenase
LNVLIIGLGQIGLQYDLKLDPKSYIYSHARAFSESQYFSLIGGVDTNLESRKLLEKEYSVPSFASIEEAFSKTDKIDLVVLSANTEINYDLFHKIVENYQIKAILHEKPLTNDYKKASKIVDICKERDIDLFVNYIRRSDISTSILKDKISSGELGTKFKGVFYYTKGLKHNASHLVNLFEYWFGDLLSHHVTNFSDSIVDDENLTGCLKFKNLELNFHSLWKDAYAQFSFDLYSDKGLLRYEKGGTLIKWYGIVPHPGFSNSNLISSDYIEIENDMNFYQRNVVNELENFFTQKPFKLCSGEDALITVKNIESILENKHV